MADSSTAVSHKQASPTAAENAALATGTSHRRDRNLLLPVRRLPLPIAPQLLTVVPRIVALTIALPLPTVAATIVPFTAIRKVIPRLLTSMPKTIAGSAMGADAMTLTITLIVPGNTDVSAPASARNISGVCAAVT